MTTPPTPEFVYHLAREAAWQEAQSSGAYAGTPGDRADGFLHFSTREQIVQSAAIHRAGEAGLVLLEVRTAAVASDLRWEESRGGALFPHLYGDLPVAAVHAVHALPLDDHGVHVFPWAE